MAALTRDELTADIANAIGIGAEEIGAEANLHDLGLDSIRLMSLIEKWRAAGVEGADFVTLASEPTLRAWTDRITTG